MPSDKPRVFLSYALKDGADFAAALRQRLEREHPEITLWQDRTHMIGGVGWWKQIEEALDAVEYLILVMTPGALESPITRKEWRYARQQGVCICPVEGPPGLKPDFDAMPQWMRKAHFYDLDRMWDLFISRLKGPCEAVRVPFMAPDMPEGFVQRPEEFGQLLEQLLDPNRENPVAITTALHGVGGFGKTTLAIALCHDDDVITAFDDGILWTTLGENPNPLEALTRLYAALTGDRPGFVDTHDAAYNLSQKLEGRNCLLVIDDAWDASHLRPFLRGGKDCARLITTRNFELVIESGAEAACVDVDEMKTQEAVELLVARASGAVVGKDGILPESPETTLPQFQALARRLGEWPLLLGLAGATLRQRIARGDSIEGALGYLNTTLDRQGVTAFDHRRATERHQAVANTIGVSLDLLETDERHRYAELAIFPEDTDVPLTAIGALWGTDDFETEQLVELLDGYSFLKYDLPTRSIRLHDVLRSYLAAQLGDPAALHARLLDAWGNLSDLPDAYAWRWAGYHLYHAGRLDQLRALLCSFDYLQSKLEATDVNAVIAEYDYFPDDRELRLIQGAIRLSARVLAHDQNQLASQLTGRLLPFDSETITLLLKRAKDRKHTAWLRPLSATLTSAGGPLLNTLTGHTEAVWQALPTPDGKRAVSASVDKTLKVWDLASGLATGTLKGHGGGVRSVAVSPDGHWLISASWDQSLKVWDLESGREKRTLKGHTDRVWSVTLTPNGRFAVSASADRTLRLWDLREYEELLTLAGHREWVRKAAISPNGKYVVSASGDRTLRVWDLHTGQTIRTLTDHKDAVWAVAITPDGHRIVSGSDDKTVKVWDLDSGTVLSTLRGHLGRIWDVAVSPDGDRIVSASSDGTLKVWNLRSGKELVTHAGHNGPVFGVAILADSERAITASFDKTLKIWDISGKATQSTMPLRNRRISALAVTPDGRHALSASSGEKITVWDMRNGRQKATLRGHTEAVTAIAVLPDSRRAVSASGDKTIKVWDIEAGSVVRTLEGHGKGLRVVAMFPDGQRLIAASDDDTPRVWDIESGEEEMTLKERWMWVRALAVLPDGERAISGFYDSSLVVWDLKTGNSVQVLKGHSLRVLDVAIFPEGRQAISGSYDHTVRFWDLQSGECIRTIPAHAHWVTAVALFPDGNLAISASSDQMLKVWDMEKGNEVAAFTCESPLWACSIARDGRTIVAGDQVGRLHLLHLEGLQDADKGETQKDE